MRRVLIFLKKNKRYFLFLPLPILVIIYILVIFLLNQELPEDRLVLKKTSRGHFSTIGLTPSPTEPITLVFTGDVIPARSVNSTMVRLNNFKYPFEKTTDFLKTADLTIINLEAPLVKNCPVTDTGMIFCGDPRFIEGLTFAGIDVVTLANNHASNWGKEGIDQTTLLLNQNGILVTGINNIVYKTIKGVNFSFIGFNGVSPFVSELSIIDKAEIENKVKEAKETADLVVVLYHWGKEYASFPTADLSVSPFDPVEIGRFTIDCGADLVVGSHPHIIQGYETYKGKPIFYSLGNFIFDQMWSEETRIGMVLQINFLGNKLTDFSFHPVKIENYFQPKFLEGKEKEVVINKIRKLE